MPDNPDFQKKPDENPSSESESHKEIIPEGKSIITMGTVEGFPYGAEYTLMRVEGDNYFKNKGGAKIANVQRFPEEGKPSFHDKAKNRLNKLLDKNPDLQEVNLRYGGMTEVTVFSSLFLLQKGITVNFERYNRDTESYEPYYSLEPNQSINNRSQDDFNEKSLGTLENRHSYPQHIQNFIFPINERTEANLGSVQREFTDDKVSEYLFDKADGKTETHHTGVKGVSIDVSQAPQLTLDKIHSYIENNQDVDHVNLYYSGLTEVTIIALFELSKAGKSVSLMGHDRDNDTYKIGVFVPRNSASKSRLNS